MFANNRFLTNDLRQFLSDAAYAELLSVLRKQEAGGTGIPLAQEIEGIIQADLRNMGAESSPEVARRFLGTLTPSQIRIYAGVARYRMGDVPGAMAEYEKALALDTNSEMARFNLGQAQYALGSELHAQGNRRESVRLLHRARRNLDASRRASGAPSGDAKGMLDHIDQCLADEESGASRDADDAPSSDIVRELEDAKAANGSKSWHSAIRKFRTLIDHAQADNNARIECLARSGLCRAILVGDRDIPAARAQARRAVELGKASGDTGAYADALGSLAVTHLASGEIGTSLQLNEEALNLAESINDIDLQRAILNAIANNHRAAGDHEQARRVDEKVATLGPR